MLWGGEMLFWARKSSVHMNEVLSRSSGTMTQVLLGDRGEAVMCICEGGLR